MEQFGQLPRGKADQLGGSTPIQFEAVRDPNQTSISTFKPIVLSHAWCLIGPWSRNDGAAFHPCDLTAQPAAETACPCGRARLAGRVFHHGWAALDLPAGADRPLRRSLWHGDLRECLDHRGPAVQPVRHPALACPPRDRERISLHGAYRDPVDADLSGGVHAKWPAGRRAADHELAL